MTNQFAISFSNKYASTNKTDNYSKTYTSDFNALFNQAKKKSDLRDPNTENLNTKYRSVSSSFTSKSTDTQKDLRETTRKQSAIQKKKFDKKEIDQDENKKLNEKEISTLAQMSGVSIEFIEQLMNGEAAEDIENQILSASDMQALMEAVQEKLSNIEQIMGVLSSADSNSETMTPVIINKLTSVMERLEELLQMQKLQTKVFSSEAMELLMQKASEVNGELEGLKSSVHTAEAAINQTMNDMNTLNASQKLNAQQNNIHDQSDQENENAVQPANEVLDSNEDGDKGSGFGNSNSNLGGKVTVLNLVSKPQNTEEEVIPFNNVLNTESNNMGVEAVKKQMDMQGASKENIMKQVVDNAKVTLTDDRSEMVMQLKPDNLGKLSLKIVTERGMMVAQFTAESQQVKEIIEANLSQLRDALESQGLNVKGFSVSVGNQNQQGQAFEKESKGKVRKVTDRKEQDDVVTGYYDIHPSTTSPYQWSDSSVDFSA
jgi:flagellar hook-length control protein FliK